MVKPVKRKAGQSTLRSDQFAGGAGETRTVGKSPQGNLSVEKEPHVCCPCVPNIVAMVAFARSMLSGMVNRPRASPMRFDRSALRKGVMHATFRPRREIITRSSFPLTRDSTILERCVLASWMLILIMVI